MAEERDGHQKQGVDASGAAPLPPFHDDVLIAELLCLNIVFKLISDSILQRTLFKMKPQSYCGLGSLLEGSEQPN